MFRKSVTGHVQIRNLFITSTKNKFASEWDNPVPKNENVPNKQKLQEWQKVMPKGRGFDQMLKHIQKNDSLISDPEKAKKIASEKMDNFQKSLTMKGFSRETKPYTPPSNLEETFNDICKQVLNTTDLNTNLDDSLIKFKLINKCMATFQHELPSSELHKIKLAKDVFDYFSKEVRGVTTFDSLAMQSPDNLPKNLHIIPEYIRYNPDNDTFFNGKDAFPQMPAPVKGLRASKKYDSYKTPMEWPDV